MFKSFLSSLRAGPGKAAGWLAFAPTQSGLCACQVVRDGGRPRILHCAAVHAGDFSPSALEEAARGHRPKRQNVTTLLKRPDYQVFVVEAPRVAEEEMKTAIRWRVKDMLAYPIEEATVDMADIPADRHAPGRSRSVYVFAARNEAVRRCAEAFEQARIGLQVMDVPEMAQRNIARLFEPEGMAVAFLNFTHEGGLLTFTYDGELYLARSLEVTAEQLAEAGPEKRQGYFSRIGLELQRSLDYFDRQMHFLPMNKLVLAPMAVEEELRAYLAEQLFVPVELSRLEEVLDFSAVPALEERERQAECLMALGAALRQEEKRP